ncbi:LysR family transcriptional regulator [Pelagibius sp. Alg239-R121]|uniref:LysR family transcriptional regulator n=1 Tax=Pelagibius sp. Alg239-R121 TaxID=2993448 RepID=UPI0024A6B9EA|nr:LysR family transcriptional regulator [Pelagibius sp. Alg239-R121]
MLHTLRNPDIHLLRVFVSVVESGGFSAAQITLNVAQSTISTQIGDLETRLGRRLCLRGRTGFSMTDDGLVIYEAAKTLFKAIDKFTALTNARCGVLSGELRIAFDDALVDNPDFLLEQAIVRFCQRSTDVVYSLNTCNPLDIAEGVLDERIHIGISTFPNHVPGMKYLPLFTEQQTLYCGCHHPLFSLSDEALTREIIQDQPYAQRAYYGGSLKTGNFQPTAVEAKADTMEALLLLIKTGRFIAHLPTGWAQKWVRNGQIRPLLPQIFSYDSQFEVVVRVNNQLINLVEAFLSDLFSCYGEARKGSFLEAKN